MHQCLQHRLQMARRQRVPIARALAETGRSGIEGDVDDGGDREKTLAGQ